MRSCPGFIFGARYRFMASQGCSEEVGGGLSRLSRRVLP
jgi:hypothetical protein